MPDSIVFAKALADETRQRIMRLLSAERLCVNDVVAHLGDVSQPTVSHHLSILRDAGLVQMHRRGKQVFYAVDQTAVAECCGQLLDTFAPERSLSNN